MLWFCQVHTAETTRCLKSQVCQLLVVKVEFDYSESSDCKSTDTVWIKEWNFWKNHIDLTTFLLSLWSYKIRDLTSITLIMYVLCCVAACTPGVKNVMKNEERTSENKNNFRPSPNFEFFIFWHTSQWRQW